MISDTKNFVEIYLGFVRTPFQPLIRKRLCRRIYLALARANLRSSTGNYRMLIQIPNNMVFKYSTLKNTSLKIQNWSVNVFIAARL